MTPLRVSIAAAIASVLLILVVLELIRSRRLRERYALLWLATGLVLLVLSAWRGGLNTIAGWLGVTGYPPAVLFAVGDAVHPRRAPALLDRDLAALRPELDPRAAGRAARGAAAGQRDSATEPAADRGDVAAGAGSSREFAATPIGRASRSAASRRASAARASCPAAASPAGTPARRRRLRTRGRRRPHRCGRRGRRRRSTRAAGCVQLTSRASPSRPHGDVDLAVDGREDPVHDDRLGRRVERLDERDHGQRNERQGDGEPGHEPAGRASAPAAPASCGPAAAAERRHEQERRDRRAGSTRGSRA